MDGYLGEVVIAEEDTEFALYTTRDWALFWITNYGGIDGAHHKDWVLDQVVRILLGTKVIIKKASWENGYTELRVSLGTPTAAYEQWVALIKAGEDGPDTYEYKTGIAP